MENNNVTYILNGGSKSYGNIDIPKELLAIADIWYFMSNCVGDRGCCVLGAYMIFDYNGTTYKMMPQSPWQGESSWTKNKDLIRNILEQLGCSNVTYEYGRMD